MILHPTVWSALIGVHLSLLEPNLYPFMLFDNRVLTPALNDQLAWYIRTYNRSGLKWQDPNLKGIQLICDYS